MNVKPLALLMLALSAISTLVLLDALVQPYANRDETAVVWLAGSTSVLLILGSLVEQLRK